MQWKRRFDVLPHGCRYSPRWAAAVDRLLNLCVSEGIDPEMFCESVIDTIGWYCNKHNRRLRPQQVAGPRAIERYNKWLLRQRERQQTTAPILSDDVRLRAESAYIETYASLRLSGVSRGAGSMAMKAALSVDEDYVRCPRRRMMALCNTLHTIHPQLPDVLVLRSSWSLRSVFDVVTTVIR